MAGWKACRASPKVAENGGFPAKFEHLYTTLTWRFFGWGARDIVCCESTAFIFRPSSFIGAAVGLRAQGEGARGVGDGRVSWPIPDGAVDLSLLLHNDAPWGRHWSARFGRVSKDASASGRLMVIFLF